MKPTPMRRHHLSDAQALEELGSVLKRNHDELAAIAEEYAARWNQAARLAAVKSGDAMPGGHFPIKTQGDLDAAVVLRGRTNLSKSAVEAHIKKMAAKHKLKLPPSLATA